MSTAPIVVVGPGSVGCGVVAASAQADGQPFVLVARTRARAERLRSDGVRVRHSDRPGRPATTLRPSAVISVDDPALQEVVSAASMVFVAVGSGQARTLVPALATALARRDDPVPVLVCDNREGAAGALRSLVAEHGVGPVSHRFAGVLVEPIVNRTGRGPGLDLVAEGPGGLFADRAALGGTIPRLAGLEGIDHFVPHLTRKRFVFSAGHAAAAYLGGASGCVTLPEALADEDVTSVVRAVMREGQLGVAHRYGVAFGGDDLELERLLRRFRSAALADPVERVGRDPRRKLARGDRICGPALLVLQAGGTPAALAVSAAAALWWGSTLDRELAAQRARVGARSLLSRLTGLPQAHPFVDLAMAGYAVLSEGGTPGTALRATTHRLVSRVVP